MCNLEEKINKLPREQRNSILSVIHCAESNKYYSITLSHNDARLLIKVIKKLITNRRD